MFPAGPSSSLESPPRIPAGEPTSPQTLTLTQTKGPDTPSSAVPASPPGHANAVRVPCPEAVFVERLTDLLTDQTAVGVDRVPEALKLDIGNLHKVQDGLQRVTVLALVAVLVGPLLPQVGHRRSMEWPWID